MLRIAMGFGQRGGLGPNLHIRRRLRGQFRKVSLNRKRRCRGRRGPPRKVGVHLLVAVLLIGKLNSLLLVIHHLVMLRLLLLLLLLVMLSLHLRLGLRVRLRLMRKLHLLNVLLLSLGLLHGGATAVVRHEYGRLLYVLRRKLMEMLSGMLTLMLNLMLTLTMELRPRIDLVPRRIALNNGKPGINNQRLHIHHGKRKRSGVSAMGLTTFGRC